MSKLNHASLVLPEGPVVGQRRRFTAGRVMAVGVLVAIFGGSQVVLLAHMQHWEARRTRMYAQRDLTMAILSETLNEISVVKRRESETPHLFLSPTKTAEWSITARKLYPRQGNKQGPDRLKVSGGNGEYALKPIRIEIYDPLVEIPLLARLRQAYEARHWAYEVVPPPADPTKDSWWYGLINPLESRSETLN